MAAAPFPNYFANRAPWLVITFGGSFKPRAALVEINGIKTIDAWQKQKSKETSGQVAVFQGTTWGDPELTFEAVDEADFDDLRALWDMLAPVPGSNATTGTATTPSQTFAIGSPAAPGSSSSSSSSGSNFAIPGNEPSKVPSVGPRPPTVSVQYLPLLWHGITALARAEWEGPIFTETGSIRHKLKFLADKPPTPAGTGAMGPPQGSQFAIGSPSGAGGGSGGGSSAPATPTGKMDKNAAAGSAGT